MRPPIVCAVRASRDFARLTKAELAALHRKVNTYDPQRKIDICLECTRETCKRGDCPRMLDKIKPYDPKRGSAFRNQAKDLVEINGKMYTLTQLAKAAWTDAKKLRAKLDSGAKIEDIINIEEALE